MLQTISFTCYSLSSPKSIRSFNFFSQQRRSVHFHGRVSLHASHKARKLSPSGIDTGSPSGRGNTGTHAYGDRPVNPDTLTSEEYLQENVEKLLQWFHGKKNVLCITGAGISTASGIPDYRGHNGSYHKGHQPMIHDQFMSSHSMRKRYWSRSMIGWKEFALASPNDAHYALAKLEEMKIIGVEFDDQSSYHQQDNNDEAMMRWAFTNGSQKMSIITQNVDGLHRRAASKHITELHGRNDRIKCMSCGSYHCRHEYHDMLEKTNSDWVQEVVKSSSHNSNYTQKQHLRPDGDAHIEESSIDKIQIPQCFNCKDGFYKPDVVFFGDSVPKHRVNRCYAAVDACDGLLCIGSSLAVHSAFRFVQHASKIGVPIAILNVGETRAEIHGLDVLKIEAPAAETLDAFVKTFQ